MIGDGGLLYSAEYGGNVGPCLYFRDGAAGSLNIHDVVMNSKHHLLNSLAGGHYIEVYGHYGMVPD